MKINFVWLILTLFFAPAISAQSTASNQVSKFTLEAPQLDTIKNIWIYLPENYKTSNKQYPVIYMHDAQNLFDKQSAYAGEWKIDESLDSLGNPQAIIVGIEHGGKNRIDELTPYSHEKYGGGNADRYLEFIIKTLKPHIDSEYRTLSNSKHTGIFGSSLGGLLSFYAGLKHPDIFGMIGSYSPSFWFNSKIYELAKKSKLNTETKFYFLVGTAESEEMVPDTEKMIEILQKKGIQPNQLEVKYIDGGEHNEAMWSKYFPESYIWLLPKN